MKYSIILPVRNGSNHVKECVTSILSQTFPDFELIVLENASPSKPAIIVHLYPPHLRKSRSYKILTVILGKVIYHYYFYSGLLV